MKKNMPTIVLTFLLIIVCFASYSVKKSEVSKIKINESTSTKIINKENIKEDTLAKEKIEEKVELKTDEEIAEEVIQGLWGLGEERFKKLEEAGYDPSKIQGLVDAQMPSVPVYNYQYSNYNYSANYCDSYGSDIGQAIASTAYNYVGWLPYVWGGADLNSGVDCSGFVMSLYALYGYSIGRTVSDIAWHGYSVSVTGIAPGDIVVYCGHVALYVGNGMVIHAPVPGRYVEVANMYMMPICDIRRIV